ncbi:MAG: cytochrome b5 domain-containing protein [Candidatus Pacebacteria bacterium]|nr:cytochrome b5 domain-containing protein [Candidatus Paceibacterota bacterium]
MKQLKKKEKKMLIALGVVAVFGSTSLFNIYKPDKTELEVISESEEVVEEKKAEPKSYSSSGGGGGRKSGGSGGGATKPRNIAMSEFQKHTKSKDCWVLMDGEVYNITNFINEYPTYGNGATEFCGTVGFEAGFLSENKIRDTIKSKSQKMGIIG